MRRDDLQTLQTDGIVAVEHYLDEGTVRALLAATAADETPGGAVASVRIKRGVVLARRNLLSLPAVRAFAASKAVASIVEAVEPGATAVRAILFDKTGEANWTVPWHQDRSIAVRERIGVAGFGPWSTKAGMVHVQPPVEVLQQMVTLRFNLDACGADNGPLRAVGATHHCILDPRAVEEAGRRGPELLCTTAAGGVVVMRPLVLHASSPAARVSHRRVLHIEFGPARLPGGLAWAMA